MKITKSYLNQIIKEEIEKILEGAFEDAPDSPSLRREKELQAQQAGQTAKDPRIDPRYAITREFTPEEQAKQRELAKLSARDPSMTKKQFFDAFKELEKSIEFIEAGNLSQAINTIKKTVQDIKINAQLENNN